MNMNATEIFSNSDLSIPKVSALIAGLVFLMQFVLPSLVPILALSVLNEHEGTIRATSSTWSRVATMLHSSYWPTLLRADSASANGVSLRIDLVSWVSPMVKVLLAITSIVTPLGLSQGLTLSKSPTMTVFQYAPDPSVFGQATIPRSDYTFSRLCGGYPFWACPGKVVNVSEADYNEDVEWSSNDIRIPKEVYDVFTSGMKDLPPTVSGWFDIQWRSISRTRDALGRINNGSDYVVGSFRNVASVLLNDRIEVIDGLIVDSHQGSIGFRNHSRPSSASPLGSTWSEDILFIEPETQCVDTNITMDFVVPHNSTQTEHLALVDHGGFVNIDRGFNWRSLESSNLQLSLDLRQRAYGGAWINNMLSMQALGVMNTSWRNSVGSIDSALGRRYRIPTDRDDNTSNGHTSLSLDTEAVSSNTEYGSYMPHELGLSTAKNSSYFKNPLNITSDDFFLYSAACRGQGGGDKANMNNVAVACGLVFGARSPVNDTNHNYNKGLPPYPGTAWSIPVFSCASATRAVIKSVQFKYVNGSNGMGITVLGILEKVYNSDLEKPRWIVENTKNNLSTYDPIWGVASTEYGNKVNTSSLQREFLWLPGYSLRNVGHVIDGKQNAPGSTFYIGAMSSTFNIGETTDNRMDYSGKTNLAVYRAWQKASRSSDGIASMMRSVWTDVAANSVVGTKGWVSQTTPPRFNLQRRPSEPFHVPTYTYSNVVKFNYLYGIPAFVLCFVGLLLVAVTLVTGVRERVGPRKLRRYINRTSIGVSAMALLDPACTGAIDKQWEETTAKQMLIVGAQRPRLSNRHQITAASRDKEKQLHMVTHSYTY